MKFVRQFNHYITAIFFITIILIIVTSYYAFKEVVGIHHQRQQEAIVPLFALITSDIVRPLSVSHFMANDQLVIDYIQQDTIDKNVLLNYLEHYAKQYDMVTFIALEKHDFMIDSNNKQVTLGDGSAEWFHRLKKQDADQFADIGNVDDPHLFFDIKLYHQQEFLGFIGTGVDLNYFAEKFSEFYRRFGFELYFVDENNNITLSSNYLMKTEKHHRRDEIINIDTLPWYQQWLTKQHTATELRPDSNDAMLVSQMPIQALKWHLYIVSPPASQQREYWQLFLSKFGTFAIISLALYLIFITTVNYFKSSIFKDAKIDFLTKLPNRSFIYWKFKKLADTYQSACVVIADIDHFKIINDTHGHLTGDNVLKAIANEMSTSLRQIDLIARWGGEEFLMILPNTSVEQAFDITERIRKNIEQLTIINENALEIKNVTISFGITLCQLNNANLDKIIAEADKALYQAKNNGRNQVFIHQKQELI
ncbi:diguanylate cyclase [Colwelliaceae bacterium 6471]